MPRKIILNITPQTHVRATQGDSVFFRIPREKLRPSGLSRLMRLEKYNQYKIELSDSLMAEDKQVAHLEVQKRWVDFDLGWIEISTKDYEEVLDLPSPK